MGAVLMSQLVQCEVVRSSFETCSRAECNGTHQFKLGVVVHRQPWGVQVAARHGIAAHATGAIRLHTSVVGRSHMTKAVIAHMCHDALSLCGAAIGTFLRVTCIRQSSCYNDSDDYIFMF